MWEQMNLEVLTGKKKKQVSLFLCLSFFEIVLICTANNRTIFDWLSLAV